MKCQPMLPGAAQVVRGLLVGLMLAGVGCSENKRQTITGAVSYKGQPVSAGIVKFHGPGDQLQMAYIRDGTYTITDVTPGEIKVTVEPDPSPGKTGAVPKKYADLKSAGLVFTITPSTKDLPIKLE